VRFAGTDHMSQPRQAACVDVHDPRGHSRSGGLCCGPVRIKQTATPLLVGSHSCQPCLRALAQAGSRGRMSTIRAVQAGRVARAAGLRPTGLALGSWASFGSTFWRSKRWKGTSTYSCRAERSRGPSEPRHSFNAGCVGRCPRSAWCKPGGWPVLRACDRPALHLDRGRLLA
jgi:hypothetical protein